jgi:protein-disulfide isomerase
MTSIHFLSVYMTRARKYANRMRKTIFVVAFLIAALGAQTSPVRSRGVPNAPIMIEVYSDYQCPYCKIVYEKTLVPLMADYVDKGKVYLVHHEFPITQLHPHAMEAACYACAANRVGKYEQACDVLFRQQSVWAANGKVDETVCGILSPADAKKVRALAKDPAIVAEVEQDIHTGQSNRVDTTPTLILTHRLKQYRLPGAASYDLIRRFIDQLLAQS